MASIMREYIFSGIMYIASGQVVIFGISHIFGVIVYKSGDQQRMNMILMEKSVPCILRTKLGKFWIMFIKTRFFKSRRYGLCPQTMKLGS